MEKSEGRKDVIKRLTDRIFVTNHWQTVKSRLVKMNVEGSGLDHGFILVANCLRGTGPRAFHLLQSFIDPKIFRHCVLPRYCNLDHHHHLEKSHLLRINLQYRDIRYNLQSLHSPFLHTNYLFPQTQACAEVDLVLNYDDSLTVYDCY